MGKYIGSSRFLEHNEKRKEAKAIGLKLKSSAKTAADDS